MDLSQQIEQLRKGRRTEFSAISGYNYYTVPDELPETGAFPALHRKSDVLYRMEPGPVLNKWEAEEQIRWHRDFVLLPAAKNRIEWPVDLVRIRSGQGRTARERLYWVFLHRPMPELEPLKKFLYLNKKREHLDWRTEPVRKTAVSFLRAMADLHDSGYTYNDFNIHRIGRDPGTGRIFLLHTAAIRKLGSDNARNELDPAQTAVEFAPSCEGVDRDLYAVAAILFRMMIGRLPYQGWQIEQNTHVFDSNYYELEQEDAYRSYFERYHDSHCFIFDPADDGNRLSSGFEEEQARERWSELPDRIRTMFINALAYTDPQNQDRMVLYTPQQWLAALERCCWIKKEGETTDER